MEVRAGYKQTEIGMLPADWNLDFIENVALITTGSKNTQDRIEDGAYPFFVRSQKVERINSYSFDGEAVLTAGDGVGTGKVFHYINGKFDVHQRVYRISNFSERIDGYFFYLYFSTHFYNRIMQMTAKSSVDSVRRDMIARMVVPLPPTEAEQHAIATALSDVDAMLDGLTRLIAKKRDLKQATMQQLLTCKTRLPGFTAQWEVKRLGELLTICHGKSQHEVEAPDGAYPILATGGQIGTACRPLYDKPSVLIGRKGTINQPQYMDTPFWTVDTLFYSAIKGENSAKFLYFCFCLINWMQYNEASGVPSLNARTIENIELECPMPDEQAAIATVLADMDAELAALETRLAKTRALKQAMMQELLTGKTRLHTPEVAHA
jgi:type I restriction enzyme S subunit